MLGGYGHPTRRKSAAFPHIGQAVDVERCPRQSGRKPHKEKAAARGGNIGLAPHLVAQPRFQRW